MTSRDTYDIETYEQELMFEAAHQENKCNTEAQILDLKIKIANTYTKLGIAIPPTIQNAIQTGENNG